MHSLCVCVCWWWWWWWGGYGRHFSCAACKGCVNAAAGVFSKRRWKQDPKRFVAIYGADIASVIQSIGSERVAVITMYQVNGPVSPVFV